jgi:two-component system, chemotaxis family, CheB/CheR fusion protein
MLFRAAAESLLSAVNSPTFPIVGIGASAGGIDAFHLFFNHMPADCGMAFVVLLHLPAERKSMLVEILTRWTGMTVTEGVSGTRLLPNHIYVPPPHSLVRLTGGQLEVTDPESEVLFRPIDVFFDSLATELGEKSIGIVLSGTGTDGALGLKAIKACGGLTFAQGTARTAPQYPEMPAGAIATGSVDLVTPVEEMPAHLLRLCGAKTQAAAPGVDATEKLRLEICAALRKQLGHDFSGYRSQTFWRRVERRMQVLNSPSIPAYVEVLSRSPEEATMLFRDLLIRVTRFFRDRETFEVLESKVMPLLFANKHADATVRVWVPGCATGEEAYSLAILIREYMDRLDAPPKVQIFATDIDDSAISVARLGRYPASLVEGLSDERLERFFTHSHGGYIVSKEIRNLCTFSMHNLVRDPPFSMMSLVSCRNLLIYMNNELQARVIPIFHYALVPDGILLLGSAESVVHHTDLFAPLDKAARIFQRKHGRGPAGGVAWNRTITSYSMPQPETTQSGTQTGKDASMNREARELPLTSAADNTARRKRFEHLLSSPDASPSAISALQAALSSVLDEHGSLAEQYQTALEELRSANEELHSVNEEMQSTNEELETSKEELQSVNEELHTVNIRLTDKIAELDRSNSDLRNLFDSTESPRSSSIAT